MKKKCESCGRLIEYFADHRCEIENVERVNRRNSRMETARHLLLIRSIKERKHLNSLVGNNGYTREEQ